MQIKQFEGKNMEEVLARVKKTLGEDALILSTRKKGSSGLGAFTSPVYEVSAAVDRSIDTASPAVSRRFIPPAYRPPVASRVEPGEAYVPKAPAPPAAAAPAVPPFEAFLSLEKELAPLKEEIASLKSFLSLIVAEQGKKDPPEQKDAVKQLAGEVRALHDLLKREAHRSPPDKDSTPAAVPPPAPSAAPKPEVPEEWLTRRLLAQGIEPETCRSIREAALNRCARRDRATMEELHREAGVLIESAVRVGDIAAPLAGSPRILAFVGPTGAGKTATVARAGKLLARKGYRCAVIAVGDSPEAGGYLYSRLQRPLGIPVLSAGDGDALSRAVSTCYGAHFILIDVAGDHCANREAIGALSAMFARHAGIEFCLTLPADWSGPPAEQVLDGLSPLPVQYLAFTRMDKTARYGGMFLAAARTGRPVLAFSTGEKDGGEIFPARPYMFPQLLLDKKPHVAERAQS